MPRATPNAGRVVLGVLSLFAAWALGGFLGSIIYPASVLVGGRESLAAKVGCSVAILVASLIVRRYLLRSFWLAVLCLATVEVLVLLIIMFVSGLTTLTLADVRFNAGWLYGLTWNVVVAFLFGTAIGYLWDRKAANKALHATAAAPGS